MAQWVGFLWDISVNLKVYNPLLWTAKMKQNHICFWTFTLNLERLYFLKMSLPTFNFVEQTQSQIFLLLCWKSHVAIKLHRIIIFTPSEGKKQNPEWTQINYELPFPVKKAKQHIFMSFKFSIFIYLPLTLL